MRILSCSEVKRLAQGPMPCEKAYSNHIGLTQKPVVCKVPPRVSILRKLMPPGSKGVE